MVVDKPSFLGNGMGMLGSVFCPIEVIAFVECQHRANPWIFADVPTVESDDELAMLVFRSPFSLNDRLMHGLVAYISSMGFEMLTGTVSPTNSRVSFVGSSFRLDEDACGSQYRSSSNQIFTALFKRPTPKSAALTFLPITDLALAIRLHVLRISYDRFADSKSCLCSEDLVGIEELSLLPSSPYRLPHPFANDSPMSYAESRTNLRFWSQPVQGFGHRAPNQSLFPLRYHLKIVGVNQAGFLSFVHMMLMVSGFRIVSASIETLRGSYVSNTYEIETFSSSAERLLRANFQCIVPIRCIALDQPPHPFHSSPPKDVRVGQAGVWYEDGLSGYYGSISAEGREGFGRFWKCDEKQSLANYCFEGDWVRGSEHGYGFRLTDDSSGVCYAFGRFDAGELVDGCIIYPFEPPAKSVRIDPGLRPDQCVYRTLIIRAERWRRQLPRLERPIAYFPSTKLHASVAPYFRSNWVLFAESPVPAAASMNACQVAALLEACGLAKAAEAAFAHRIDGGLLEAMSESHLEELLGMHSPAQRNMFVHFLSVLLKAYNIDRHMRQPSSVLDALVNPAVNGKFFPLEKMRMVDHLGEGAYGKVVYAEFNHGQSRPMSKTASLNSIVSAEQGGAAVASSRLNRTTSFGRTSRAPSVRAERSQVSDPDQSMNGGRVYQDRMFVALKEQIGSGADLENACELVREWATLNALPHENIVKLEGICGDANAPMFNKRYLATALIEASLPSLVYANDAFGPAPPLTPLLTLQLAGDIASGLAHMHSMHILHGDIKSPNVLVDLRTRDRPVARLCDFGHAAIRIGPRPQRRMCTFGWASPESLRDTDTDTSADVWSWATVCWEMYVKEVPWKGCSHPQMLVAVGYCGLAPGEFRGKYIPERVTAEKKMHRLCQRCWSPDPHTRPSMETVLRAVDKLGRTSATQAIVEMQSLLR